MNINCNKVDSAMRILYFSSDYTTHDRRFLSAMAGAGREVFFLRLQDDGIRYESRPLPKGVTGLGPIEGGGSDRADLLGLMPGFERVISEARPDLIHAGPVPSCAFMAALSGFRPLLTMSWGSDILLETANDPAAAWKARYALNQSDMFQCDCRAVEQAARDLAPDSPAFQAKGRVIRFPWGIEPRAYLDSGPGLELRRDLGWTDKFVIISLRTWAEIYGIDTVLDSFALAREQNSNLRLLLLGDGPLAPMVRDKIASGGLADAVHVAGRVSQEKLKACLHAADLYLSCSLSDGTSISLLEAMGSGLPVLAGDIPGNREWIEPDENGWLAQTGDAAAFARAMVRCAALPRETRGRIGAANQGVVGRRADWNENVKTLLAAYDENDPGRRPGPRRGE